MDNQQSQQDSSEEKKGRELTEEESKKLRDGLALKEMTESKGWKVVEGWLKSRAYHAWVDPRDTESKDQWMWQELNAFHSADVAKQILMEIQQAVEVAAELEDVKLGRKQPKEMKI